MAGGGRNGKSNGNNSGSWPTLPGRQRLSWCSKNKLCRYCQDWIDVQLHGKPNTLRQACTQRPAGVKKERGLNLSATKTSLSALKPRRVTVKDTKHSSEVVKWGEVDRVEDGRTFYKSLTREKLVVRVGDYLYLTSPIENKPYIGEVIKLFETDEGEPTTTVRWLFHISDTKLTPANLYERLTANKESVEKEGVLFHDRELFYSDDFDDNPIASVEGKCHVEHLPCHLSSALFSRMSDFESEGTQGDEDSQFSSQSSNTELTPKDNELLEKLVTFIQKPDSFFFRKWYSCGHFGHMPSVDFVFSPYIDKSYENYELPQTLPAKTTSSQATPFVIDDSIPMPGDEEGGKGKEENKEKEKGEEEEEEEEEEGTITSKNSRSKRKKKPLIETSKSKKSKLFKPEPELEEEEEEEGQLALLPCQRFNSPPGSKSTKTQPFYLDVHSNASLMIDLHAHLLKSVEVIGFLAGQWYPEESRLVVEEAYPCQSLEEADNVNVEIDPVSEIMVTESIKSRGLRVVGWYHSHPLFQPDPSARDLHTQKSYQQLVKDEASGHEVFVGAIAAVYDERLPSQESVFNWFWSGTVPSSTSSSPTNGGEERKRSTSDAPFAFPHRVVSNKDIPWETVVEMLSLIDQYKDHEDRVQWNESWRDPVPEGGSPSSSSSSSSYPSSSSSSPLPKSVSRLEKLKISLSSRMPTEWSEERKVSLLNCLITRLTSKATEK